MDLTFSFEQHQIREAAKTFFKRNWSKKTMQEAEDSAKGYSVDLWKTMAELGWLGLMLPEEFGGTGAGLLDMAVVFEEVGVAHFSSPLFGTFLSGLIVREAGNMEQKRNLLTGLASGKLIVTTALSEVEAQYDLALTTTTATPEENGYVINGTKFFVPYANVADYIICPARIAGAACGMGITLFLLDPKTAGIECTPIETIAKDKQVKVQITNVKVPMQTVLGEIGKGQAYIEAVLPNAIAAKCVEMVGAMQQVLEMTTGYAKQRVQFDRPIGGFQAVQHHCANMFIAVEGSKWLAYRTAWMVSQGNSALKECYMTKAWVSDAFQRVVRTGLQVHGGMGLMKDYELQFYFRGAKGDEMVLGDADFCREKVAGQLLDS